MIVNEGERPCALACLSTGEAPVLMSLRTGETDAPLEGEPVSPKTLNQLSQTFFRR